MQVLTKQQLLDNLFAMIKRPSRYSNAYPQNLCYYDGTRISADCWNLFKAIVFSHGTAKDNYTKGKYFKVDKESGLGDWDGGTIMNNCTDVSTNFSSLEAGEVLLYYDKTHFGIYVGTFHDESGECNCIEASPFVGGIQSSYMDAKGNRFNHKGGKQGGRWGWHGKPTKWVSGYGEQPKPVPPTPLVVNGLFDKATITKLQQVLGTTADGFVSHQWEGRYVASYVKGQWQFDKTGIGSLMVKALQTMLKKEGFYTDKIDGLWGRNTTIAMQKFLNKHGAKLVVDGSFGPASCKALQNWLNTKK